MESAFVTANGTRFEWNGLEFPVFGVNCYFLAYCSDVSRRAAMAMAKQMGANVIRSWAFLLPDEFKPDGLAFQYFSDDGLVVQDGPNGMHRMDMLIHAAEELGLKLILPLVNYWRPLGGMATYVERLINSTDVTEFYRSARVRAGYREWVRSVLTRRNTVTGRLYCDEPSIMAWELTNEARCPGSDGREVLLGWVREMGAFVKSLDVNHLLALGDEGFFDRKGRGHLYDGGYGVDWEANLAVEDMDFGTYHFYPQDWGYGEKLEFGEQWIKDHSKAAAAMNKPVLMEEYGLRLDGSKVKTAADRRLWFGRWMDCLGETRSAGSLVWMLGQRNTAVITDTGGYVDAYVLYEEAEMPPCST